MTNTSIPLEVRVFRPVIAALLILMGAVQVASVRLESPTWDEPTHLGAGVSYWRTGEFRLNHEHPVLPKLACAAPLLLTQAATVRQDDPAWRDRDQVTFGRNLVFNNVLPADTILFRARLVSIAVTVMAGLLIAMWVRYRFGHLAAIFATALYTLDPNIIAHGRYVTTDIWATAFTFAAVIAWVEALMRGTAKWYAVAGVALGLAAGSKFSALSLLPLMAILAWKKRPRWSVVPLTVAVAFVVLAIPYAPEVRMWISGGDGGPGGTYFRTPLADSADNGSFVGDRLHHIGKALNLPSFSYLLGLSEVGLHMKVGHATYLLGQTSTTGWWYYFPVAFLVKTPVAVLVLAVAAFVYAVRKAPKERFEVAAMGWAFLVFWSFAIFSRLNIGLRHILPVYPFLYVLLAVAMVRYMPRWFSTAALLLLAIESFSIYPHYLAFFNFASGGPGRGPEYLVDSNIDWGQDSRKLKEWADRHADGKPVCVAYFGQAYPAYYGLKEAYVARIGETQQRNEMDCYAAVSATLLYGDYQDNDPLRYLRQLQPVAKIGYSIYVYDLRKKPVAAP